MYTKMYITETEHDVTAALAENDSTSEVALVILEPTSLDIHEYVEVIEYPMEKSVQETLTSMTYDFMKKSIIQNPSMSFFISYYKQLLPYIRMKYVLKKMNDEYDCNYFRLPQNKNYYNLANEFVHMGIMVDFYGTENPEGKIANLSFKRKVGERLVSMQHKTNLYPNIVLNRNFYKLNKTYKFTNNEERNVLIVVSSHVNYPRVLLPFEKVLREKGYRIFYLAQTKRVADFVQKRSNERVLSIQEFLKIRDVMKKSPTWQGSFFENNQQKILEYEKYFSVIRRIFTHNAFSLVLTADDVEPFGRYTVAQANQYQIKTVNVQHGYIADKFNYSSTISSIMFTWDQISSDIINQTKESNTKLIAIGPPHLQRIHKKGEGHENDMVVSWFPIPNKVMSDSTNVKHVLSDIKNTIQMTWTGKKVRFLIKLHPFDSLPKYQKVKEELMWNENISVDIYQHEKDPLEVIQKSDVVIALNTSIVYEAYVMGIPVLAYNPLSENLNPLLLPFYTEILNSQEELVHFIKEEMNNLELKIENKELVNWNLVRDSL